jgi:hypothetical protein
MANLKTTSCRDVRSKSLLGSVFFSEMRNPSIINGSISGHSHGLGIDCDCFLWYFCGARPLLDHGFTVYFPEMWISLSLPPKMSVEMALVAKLRITSNTVTLSPQEISQGPRPY